MESINEIDDIWGNLRALSDVCENSISKISQNMDLRLNTPTFILESEFKKYPHNLRIGHLNTISIPKHREELQRIIPMFDIFGASETFIKNGTPQSLFNFEGYKFYGKNRTNTTFGGVGLYINEQIPSKRINVKFNLPQPEMVFAECRFRKTVILVGVIYRSDAYSYKIYSEIIETLAFFTTKYTNVILLGDYNINFLCPDSSPTRFFKEQILDPLDLTQIINMPTRITATSRTLIDLIIVNNYPCVKNSGVVDFGVSDHSLTFLSYAVSRPKYKPKIIKKRNFKNFTNEAFLEDVKKIEWDSVDGVQDDACLSPITNLNNQITVFENFFTEAIDKHAPFHKVVLKRPSASYTLTDEITKLMDNRDAYKNIFNNSGDSYFYEKYRECRNLVNHAVRRAKIDDYNRNINNKLQNIKAFHRNLKSYDIVDAGIKNRSVCDFSPDDLNNFFSANNNSPVNAERLADEISRIRRRPTNHLSFRFRHVNSDEVKKVVKSLKSNACGIDKISTFFIKTSIEYIAPVLASIFNYSIEHQIFPDRWKIGIINPIPKVSEPKLLKDFRPISLLSALSKIFEKLIADQMKEFLFGNELMNKFQSSYKIFHGCTTALVHITDFIYQALDDAYIVFLVLLDYSKAFDIANHKLILAKLSAFGFERSALNWINSYLSSRCQKVVLESGESSLVTLDNGVPQGSILGPLLFTVLINDISDVIVNCQYHLYADDTQIYLKTKVEDAIDAIIKINDDLSRISTFSANNSLRINEEKSKFIIFGTNKNISDLAKVKHIEYAEIIMNDFPIERVFEARNLGVIFDQFLNWESHINKLISSAYYRLKLSYRHAKFLSEDSKLLVVEAYILSLFNYASPVLQNLTAYTANKMQKLQNSCVRFIFGLKKFDHISDCYKKRNILKMEERRNIQSLTLTHNIVLKHAPAYLVDKITYNEDYHDHNTREKDFIRVPRARTNFGQNRFFRKYCSLYNDMKRAIGFRSTISKLTFKCKIKHFILKNRVL